MEVLIDESILISFPDLKLTKGDILNMDRLAEGDFGHSFNHCTEMQQRTILLKLAIIKQKLTIADNNHDHSLVDSSYPNRYDEILSNSNLFNKKAIPIYCLKQFGKNWVNANCREKFLCLDRFQVIKGE